KYAGVTPVREPDGEIMIWYPGQRSTGSSTAQISWYEFDPDALTFTEKHYASTGFPGVISQPIPMNMDTDSAVELYMPYTIGSLLQNVFYNPGSGTVNMGLYASGVANNDRIDSHPFAEDVDADGDIDFGLLIYDSAGNTELRVWDYYSSDVDVDPKNLLYRQFMGEVAHNPSFMDIYGGSSVGFYGHSVSWNGIIVIDDDLTVESLDDITIQPGTVILVAPNVEIIVEGELIAEGKATNPIQFMCWDPTETWEGIRSSGTLTLDYVELDDLDNEDAIELTNGTANVANMTLSDHRYSFYLYESGTADTLDLNIDEVNVNGSETALYCSHRLARIDVRDSRFRKNDEWAVEATAGLEHSYARTEIDNNGYGALNGSSIEVLFDSCELYENGTVDDYPTIQVVDCDLTMERTYVDKNEGRGIYAGGSSTLDMNRNGSGNGGNRLSNNGPSSVSPNNHEMSVVSTVTVLLDEGNNDIYDDNDDFCVYAPSHTTIVAENNYWGNDPPLRNSFSPVGVVDYDPYSSTPYTSSMEAEQLAIERLVRARSLRADGQSKAAWNTLNEILELFPATSVVPAAFNQMVMLSGDLNIKEAQMWKIAEPFLATDMDGITRLQMTRHLVQYHALQGDYEAALNMLDENEELYVVQNESALLSHDRNRIEILRFTSGNRRTAGDFGALVQERHLALAALDGMKTPDGEGDAEAALPTEFAVVAYPNPFNPTTTLEVALPEANNVTLKVFNVMGREMLSLKRNDLQAGYHTFSVDGSMWATGLYFVRAQAGNHVLTQRILLMK
ncbi:T9SS type A sorting domain-containing protein, partial [bacterium]|nr:T9SS type A sorting domain-containing protein [bacterium]